MTSLVTQANDLALFDDYTRTGYFRKTGSLMDCTTHSSDDGIKPQGIVSKIVVNDLHETEIFDTNIEFANPTETFSLETEHADLHATDAHPDRGCGHMVSMLTEQVLQH